MEIIRDRDLLHPELCIRITKVINEYCRLATQTPVIYETWRTPQRQRALFEQGITKADAWDSWHQYGLAVDLVFDNDDSKRGIQDPYKGDFYLLGGLSIKEGLSWGGEWGDLVHFQMTADISIGTAKNLYAELGLLGLWREISKKIADHI